MVALTPFWAPPRARGAPPPDVASAAPLTADDFADLPEQMKQTRRWLVRKGKQPFYANGNPRSGRLDGPADVANFATFDEALHALRTGEFNGLGFALGPDPTGRCWQGIDLDDLPGRPELQHLADALPGYTERSPSGKGMHAIGYGRPFTTLSPNGTGIEAYSSGRYFTVTAAGAGLHGPCDLADFVERDLQPLHSKGKSNSPAANEDRVETVDPKVITELRSALRAIPADDRDTWIRMGHALWPLGNAGRGLWMDWSATSSKFDPADAGRVWNSFKPTNTGYQAVFAEAQRQGWVNPLSNAATGRARSDFSILDRAAPLPGQENAAGAQSAPFVDLESCVIDLTETVSPDDVHPHVVEKLVPQGEVTLFAGHGSAGKSYIALLISILVALGKPFGTLATTRTRVLFFSAEDDEAELRRRAARICRALGVSQTELVGWLTLMDVSEMDPTLYRVNTKGEAVRIQRLESLAAYVKRHDIGLTVIDNASDVFDGNEIVRTQVRAFIRTIRAQLARPDRAVILLAHVSKAAANNQKQRMATTEDYSGSTAWHNSVRSRLSLESDDKGGSTLAHLKANKGPKAEPIRLEWHDGAPGVLGTIETPGASLAAALRKSAEERQDEADKAALVKVIQDYVGRGARVPVAIRGPHSAYHTLRISPDFPKGMDSDRANRLLFQLESEGRIFRSTVRSESRKPVHCFTSSPAVVESAPNPTAPWPAPSAHPIEAAS